MKSILTITTPASSQALTTLEHAKTELGITGSTEDAKLEGWIDQASAAIATYCNRSFGKATLSELFRVSDGDDAGTIPLAMFPIVSVASATENDTTLTVTTDYEVDTASGMIRRLSGDSEIAWASGKTVIVYDAGYVLPDEVPGDLERACLSLVRSLHFSVPRDPLAKRIEIPGVRTIDYWIGNVGTSGSLPPDVVDLLASYRSIPL